MNELTKNKEGSRGWGSLILLSLVILVLPLFKGGNYPGAMAVFIFVMTMILILSFSDMNFDRDKYWFFVWGIFSFVVLCHALIIPHFFGNERFFNDRVTKDLLVHIGSKGVSEYRIIEVWSFFTVMWLAAWRVAIATRIQVSIILLAILIASFFQAVFGIIHFLSEASSVMGLWVKEHYLGDATGTFVNRNHFSGMLAICWPLVLSWLLLSKPDGVLLSVPKSYRVSFAFVYSVALCIALLLAHSRMGLVAAIFGLSIWGLLYLKADGNGGTKWLLLGIVSFFILFAVWFGVEDLLTRYVELSDGNSRFSVWKVMFGFSLETWLIGVSPGAFEDVFQMKKPSFLIARFIYAHNDYLEFLFEFGVVGVFLICVSAALLLRRYPRGLAGVRLGAVAAISAVSLHSVVDFNLQVPASAICAWLAFGFFMNPNLVEVIELERKKPIKNKEAKRRLLPHGKREWLDFFRSS